MKDYQSSMMLNQLPTKANGSEKETMSFQLLHTFNEWPILLKKKAKNFVHLK
jgi:hypothetical protein